MIVSVMQPYFFPYLGYFQLVRAADVFVSYDRVQFVRHGWMNRNRILGDAAPMWFTLPIVRSNHGLPICANQYADPDGAERQRLLRKLHNQYRRAPYFDATLAVVEPLLLNPDDNVASYNLHALRGLCAHLGIRTRIEVSSALPAAPDARGEDAVIDLCRHLGARTYVNPVGGTALYSRRAFADAGLELRFIGAGLPAYAQFRHEHVGSLSIIDVLMFNDVARVATMLDDYTLVEG
jgi:hypothetical protein